jgi:hypothetical protein
MGSIRVAVLASVSLFCQVQLTDAASPRIWRIKGRNCLLGMLGARRTAYGIGLAVNIFKHVRATESTESMSSREYMIYPEL